VRLGLLSTAKINGEIFHRAAESGRAVSL